MRIKLRIKVFIAVVVFPKFFYSLFILEFREKNKNKNNLPEGGFFSIYSLILSLNFIFFSIYFIFLIHCKLAALAFGVYKV